MNWSDAKAYCASKGGKLPRIGGSNKLSSAPSGTPVDGFGSVGAKWPSGLPGVAYWTGTEDSGVADDSWGIYGYGGYVDVDTGPRQSTSYRVVCVP